MQHPIGSWFILDLAPQKCYFSILFEALDKDNHENLFPPVLIVSLKYDFFIQMINNTPKTTPTFFFNSVTCTRKV